ncbi:hypothetical protein E2C01_050967 [Portunus trituberculatus]|uniref:Uncharacterized protein n=1 Tax=Portunus trituberculatus TaxID=210409 RepID=A0A5B7GHI2_PORTR|nr:hypothetical protein [Portunus trituberculatus]
MKDTRGALSQVECPAACPTRPDLPTCRPGDTLLPARKKAHPAASYLVAGKVLGLTWGQILKYIRVKISLNIKMNEL